jgi:hypothetical protein
VPSGGAADFTIAAAPTGEGRGNLTFQWRGNGVPLTDGYSPAGVVVSGSTSPILTLSSVDASLDGVALDCVVTDSDGGGTARSDPAGLGVRPLPPGCPVDFNRDGQVDVQGYSAFLAAYSAGC